MERMGKSALTALTVAALLLTAGCDETKHTTNPPGPPATPPDKPAVTQPAPPDKPTQPAASSVEVKLYFPNETGDGLGVAKATIPAEDKYTEAVRALISGTKEPGLTGIFPEGVKVRSVRVKDGLATVDFSGELTSRFVGGSTGEQMLVSALVNTLTEFPEVERVLLTVDGKRIETISGHLDTSEPFTRPTGLVK